MLDACQHKRGMMFRYTNKRQGLSWGSRHRPARGCGAGCFQQPRAFCLVAGRGWHGGSECRSGQALGPSFLIPLSSLLAGEEGFCVGQGVTPSSSPLQHAASNHARAGGQSHAPC